MLFATNELNPLDSWHLTPYKHLRLHALLRYFVYQLFQICFSPHLKLTLKTAVIKPLLKKNIVDTTLLNNYRPISNLPFVGKIIEKLIVFNQLTTFLMSDGYFDNFDNIAKLRDRMSKYDLAIHAFISSRVDNRKGLF